MNQAHINPPDEVFKEAALAHFTTEELLEEVSRRQDEGFTHRLNVATARVELAYRHYKHNIDVTSYPYYCSDCNEEIHGR